MEKKELKVFKTIGVLMYENQKDLSDSDLKYSE
jgi:hypothetical protein